jgi:hypothetical protein
MKKILLSIGALILTAFLVVAPSELAAQEAQLDPSTQPALTHRCGDNREHAWPGNPVSLEGMGTACARGWGKVSYDVDQGTVRVRGRGIVAIKGTEDITEVKEFGNSVQIGDWKVYYGKGALEIKGEDYQVVGYLDHGKTGGRGGGAVTYRGIWHVRYEGVNRIHTEVETDCVLPESLESSISTETLEVAE